MLHLEHSQQKAAESNQEAGTVRHALCYHRRAKGRAEYMHSVQELLRQKFPHPSRQEVCISKDVHVLNHMKEIQVLLLSEGSKSTCFGSHALGLTCLTLLHLLPENSVSLISPYPVEAEKAASISF